MKISLCTPCMGREMYLEQTFGKNLEAVLASGLDIEMVILDYSSPGGVGNWLKTNFNGLIGTKIKYGRLEGKTFYSQPHAKNVSHLLGSGDVLCCLDADGFAPKEFLLWLQSMFSTGKRIHVRGRTGSGRGGRLAIRRNDFIELGGYDEKMGDGWGAVDCDFSGRAAAYGIPKLTIPDEYCVTIQHTDEIRSQNLQRKEVAQTQKEHQEMTKKNIARKVLKANLWKKWGEADLTVNFQNTVKLGVQG